MAEIPAEILEKAAQDLLEGGSWVVADPEDKARMIVRSVLKSTGYPSLLAAAETEVERLRELLAAANYEMNICGHHVQRVTDPGALGGAGG